MYRKAMTAFEIAGQAVKTSNRESESELQRTKDGNAQFSLCCTSTAMPDDDSQDRHPAFCFARTRIRKPGTSECSHYFSQLKQLLLTNEKRQLMVSTRLRTLPTELAHRSSLFPTFSRRLPRRTVPSEPILVRYLAKRSAPESRGLCTALDRRTRHGCL